MSSHKGRIKKGRGLLVAKLLIVNISNKATGMFNKSEPLEAYPFIRFQVKLSITHWNEIGCSVDTWNPFQARVKPVLLCSVDRT